MRGKVISLTVLLLAGAHSISSQDVILINGEAHEVSLSGTEVIAIKGDSSGYMDGYASKDDGFQHADLQPGTPNQSIPNRAEVAAARSKKVVTTTMASTDKIKSGNKIMFNAGSSDLSNAGKKDLKLKAADVVTKIAKSVLLETSFIRNDKESEALAKERLNVCKIYLEKNGVSSNVILSNSRRGDSKSNSVSVVLR